jgi:large subunit ribosomal protein L17
MRHQKKKVTLDRARAPRIALLRSLAEALVLNDRIITTKAKARAARAVVEKLITRAKTNNLTSRRYLMGTLYTKKAVDKMLTELGPRYVDRKGGYTRIVTVKNRVGDGAEEALIEFV